MDFLNPKDPFHAPFLKAMPIKTNKSRENIKYRLLKPNVNFILLLKISALNFISFS